VRRARARDSDARLAVSGHRSASSAYLKTIGDTHSMQASEIGRRGPNPPHGSDPEQLQRQTPEKRRRAATCDGEFLPCSVDAGREDRYK